MPRQPDIQYVQFYVDGTAARKLETNRKLQTQMPVPRKRRVARRRKKVIAIDPLSVSAVLVAGVMLVSMAGVSCGSTFKMDLTPAMST